MVGAQRAGHERRQRATRWQRESADDEQGDGGRVAAAATTRSPSDQPLRCICNLCNCGCADFHLPASGSLDETIHQDDRAAAWQALPVCDAGHGHPHEERYLTPLVGARGRSGSRQEESAAAGQQRAHYASALSSGPPGPGVGRREQEENDAELLHVLVTRPEIASRPRDNIVFEGDMDLRTTFETSYEALARMRLEHWKAQQRWDGERAPSAKSPGPHEIKGAQRERSQQREPDVSEQATSGAADSEAGAAAARQRESRSRRSAQARSETSSFLGAGRVDSTKDAASRPAHQQLAGARMLKSPARLRGGDSLVGTCLALGQVQHSDQLQMQREQRERALNLNSPVSPAQPQAPPPPPPPETRRDQAQSPFVDPDLSPIIVYDANLNRLERVGLRKRSKYRPSTSLRPGGRGFFGQSLDEEAVAVAAESARARKLDEEDTRAVAHGHQPVSPSEGDFCLRDHAAGATSESLNRDRSGGEACGRKHNLDDVNRVDHIKQFNLVENTDPRQPRQFSDKATQWMESREHERRTQLEARHERSALGDKDQDQGEEEENHHDDEKSGPIADDTSGKSIKQQTLTQAHNEDERDLLTLQREEADAVAEIQRATNWGSGGDAHRARTAAEGRGATKTSEHRHQTDVALSRARATPGADGYLSSSAAGKVAPSRQARMQRVCQHQSFNINENEYPEVRGSDLSEASIKIGGRETMDLGNASGRSTRQSASPLAGQSMACDRASKNNLFRESPDFILTTAGRRIPDQHPSGLAALPEYGKQQTPGAQVERGADDSCRAIEAKSATRDGGAHVEFEPGLNHDEISEPTGRESATIEGPCLKCRVLDLSHDFEFVCSRSGHKYFVERHFEAPISEMA